MGFNKKRTKEPKTESNSTINNFKTVLNNKVQLGSSAREIQIFCATMKTIKHAIHKIETNIG